MLSSALSALSDRLDSKFLIAFWLPAFVLVLGGLGIMTALIGPSPIENWALSLSPVAQSLVTILLVLLITMLACVLRALTWPIAATFAGDVLPQVVARWSTRGQQRARARAVQALRAAPDAAALTGTSRQDRQRLNQLFPQSETELMPTLFGNVLATASQHPRLAYAMEGALWWPRLSPVLPSFFQDMLGATQAPMMALLNLSVVFTGLALAGAAALALAGSRWIDALIILVVGLVLSRLCYRAAIGQAVALGSQLGVAFDLYRHDILRQMDLEVPTDLVAERALWQQLTLELLSGLNVMPPNDDPSPVGEDASPAQTSS